MRDNVVIHEGKLSQLKRFKDDAREVSAGQECGMAFEGYQDMKVGDVIECYRVRDGAALAVSACIRRSAFEPFPAPGRLQGNAARRDYPAPSTASAASGSLDMDDTSTPSPWQATRFEVRTTLEPLDYLHLMTRAALERDRARRVVAGGGRNVRHRRYRRADRHRAVHRTPAGLSPIGTGASSSRSPVRSWRFLIYKVFIMGPYVDSMFYGQPIGMGETTIVADTTGR